MGDRRKLRPGVACAWQFLGLRLLRRLAAFGVVQVGALVEHHQQRRQALGLDQGEDLDVAGGPSRSSRRSAARARPWRTGRDCGSAALSWRSSISVGVRPFDPRATSCGSRSDPCRWRALSSSLSSSSSLFWKPPSLPVRPAHQLQIAQHAGELVHGQRPGGFLLVRSDRSCRGWG